MPAGRTLPPRLAVYVALVVVAGTTAILRSLDSLSAAPYGRGWLILAALTLFSGSFTIKVPGIPARISVSETFVFTAVLLYGSAPATVIVALDGLVISVARRSRRLHRILFNATEPALSIFVASRVFGVLTQGTPVLGTPVAISSLVLPLFVLSATYFLLNSCLTAVAVALETRTRAHIVWRQHFLWLSLNYFGGASVALLLARSLPVLDVGAASIVLPVLSIILPLLVISYLTFKTAMGRLQDATDHVSQLNSLYLSALETLAMAIDAKDQVTHGHIRRVQLWATRLAEALGIRDASLIQAIEAAALLHDIGKIGVPEYILNKPGKLSPAELKRMKEHADIGADLVATIHYRDLVVPIVRHHHENWDGTGYPDGLAGTDIPIGARILSVVDCFDALTSDRPYRNRLTDDEAVRILIERRGTMYDPRVVDAFLGIKSELDLELPEPAPQDAALGSTTEAFRPGTPDTDGNSENDAVAFKSSKTAHELAELASRLTAVLDVADMMTVIWAHLRGIVPACTCALFAHDAKTSRLVIRHAAGEEQAKLLGHTVTFGESVTGWVAANRRSIVNADPALELSKLWLDQKTPFLSCLSTPLVAEHELVGVFSLYSRAPHAFTQEHRETVETLAPHVSRAVRDAIAAEKNGAAGARDVAEPFRITLGERPCANGTIPDRETQSTLGVVLVRLVGVKATSRKLKVPPTDSVLRHVAGVVRTTLRAADILLRSEGNEFVVLLGESNREVAATIAARIAMRAAEQPCRLPGGGAAEVRVDVGYAVQPDDGHTLGALVGVARYRMELSNRPSVESTVH